ncbi:MAG: helicase associated domain-containing protein [bacterium]
MLSYIRQLKSDLRWEERFNELLKYRDLYGTVNVPNRNKYPEYPFWERRLGSWVATQRQYIKKGKIAEWRESKLLSVNLDIEPLETMFEKQFADFLEFKAKYGHVLVPKIFPEKPSLGLWVNSLRSTPYKIRHLDRLNNEGFVWNSITEKWQNVFRELVEFKRTHGHFSVTKAKPEDEKLSSWVFRMRKLKRLGNYTLLTDDKIKLLDSIGFNWVVVKSTWDKNYNNLLEFKCKNGHCNVPLKYSEIWGLGTWVYAMRKNKNKLAKEKVKRLDSIGFNWELDPTEIYTHSVSHIF